MLVKSKKVDIILSNLDFTRNRRQLNMFIGITLRAKTQH